jgi:hypothetical protein
MRINVISDIGKIGDRHPEVMPILKKASSDPDRKVARAGKRAMRTIEKASDKKKKAKRK